MRTAFPTKIKHPGLKLKISREKIWDFFGIFFYRNFINFFFSTGCELNPCKQHQLHAVHISYTVIICTGIFTTLFGAISVYVYTRCLLGHYAFYFVYIYIMCLINCLKTKKGIAHRIRVRVLYVQRRYYLVVDNIT